MPCKFCDDPSRYNNSSFRSIFKITEREIPPYLEGKLTEDEFLCDDCTKVLETSFVRGLELKDLPLYINFKFMYERSNELYIERLKSAQ